MSMAEFDFFIEHRKGERNVVPDVLSRHPVNENIPEDNVVIPPENSVITFMIIATSVDVPQHTPELIHETFNNTMACLYNACLIPQADCLHPVCFAAVPKRAQAARKPQLKTSVASQNNIPQVSISQKTSSSPCNFQDFENMESLNRNRSSFAKKQLEDYWCNLLIMFHNSNHDISAIKNIPKEHLQWVTQMAKRSAVIDGLLLYRDELMEDPNHYRVMVPNDICPYSNFLRAIPVPDKQATTAARTMFNDVVVVVGASEHQSGDMMKFVFQIDLSVIAALISSLLSPVSLFKTSISVVFGRLLLRGSSGAQKISEPAGSL